MYLQRWLQDTGEEEPERDLWTRSAGLLERARPHASWRAAGVFFAVPRRPLRPPHQSAAQGGLLVDWSQAPRLAAVLGTKTRCRAPFDPCHAARGTCYGVVTSGRVAVRRKECPS